MKKLLLGIVVFLLVNACNLQPKENPEALARVGDEYLALSTLADLGLENAGPEDSSRIVNAYINNWIRKQTFLQHAKENLSAEQLTDIDEKVNDYQLSLMTHLFENEMVLQTLDTLVSEQEIVAYYESHQDDFTVNKPIFKFLSLKKDAPFESINEIDDWIDEYVNEGNDVQLKEYCAYNAVSCFLDVNTWHTTDTFYETIEQQESNSNVSLRLNRLFQVETEEYNYLYKLIESKVSGTYPVEFVAEDIRRILLRSREQELIETLRNKIFERAKQNNEIEVYEE